MIRNNLIYGILGILAIFCASLSFAAEPVDDKPVTSAYLIGPGDVLEIAVWREEALTKLVPVLPDGRIAFPLIGEMMAAGKTVDQLKKEIEAALLRFIPEPTLVVSVHQVNSMVIYVIGKTKMPGRQIVNANVNVLQALSMAGGLNEFAERDTIAVFRFKNGKTEIFPFNYDDVVKGRALEQNITLERGDVVVVR